MTSEAKADYYMGAISSRCELGEAFLFPKQISPRSILTSPMLMNHVRDLSTRCPSAIRGEQPCSQIWCRWRAVLACAPVAFRGLLNNP